MTLRIRLAACTLPPTRMRCGVLGFSGGGGGGGGAAVGTDPTIPPTTPPETPPGTPPGTPTPALGGGNSSSLIMATFLGMVLGAISLPASNWRGATFTTLGGAAAGGGGGGGGGGGAVRKLVSCARGSVSV